MSSKNGGREDERKQPLGRLLALVREFGALERRRASEGVTPLEYQRYLELRATLAKSVADPPTPAGAERRKHLRVPTRLLIQYRSTEKLRSAIIGNVSQGGLFISTAFPLEIGTKFTLCLVIEEPDRRVEVPSEVVSNNVGDGFTTTTLGMGIKFSPLNAEQRRAVDLLFAEALDLHLDSEGGME